MSRTTSPSDRKIRVVVVDDHQIFRQGIKSNINHHEDIDVVGEGANGDEALAIIHELQPDIAILDINLPHMNGIQVTRQVKSDRLPVHIVMVTGYDDREQVLHAMRAGASAYCAKEVEADQLLEIIREVMDGYLVVHDRVFTHDELEAWMDERMEATAGPYYADLTDTFSPLSPREMEILQHVTRGMSNKEIAQLLQISHQTVKNHMTAILRKLAVEDRTQAAVYALRRGWVRLEDTIPISDEDEAEDA